MMYTPSLYAQTVKYVFEENSVYECLFTCEPNTPKSKNRKQTYQIISVTCQFILHFCVNFP